MHAKTTLVAVTTLALLAGCNRGASNNSANATANAATPAAPTTTVANATTNDLTAAPPVGGGVPVDQAFLIGHWGIGGNCAQTVSFNADGSATASDTDEPARWTLNGATLTIRENEEPAQDATVSRNGDVLLVDPARGENLQLTRCPAAGAGEARQRPAPVPPSN